VSHASADAASAPRSRLEYIDGLRALAAVWVALHHAFDTATPSATLDLPVVGTLLGSLSRGQFPVMIFLMLSGFCLYYPYVRKEPRPSFRDFKSYLLRRWTRIAPPYLAAGVLCSLMLLAFPQVATGRWKEAGPVDIWTIVTHLLFVHNMTPYAVRIDYPMWSIGLEWQLYLLFPLFVWAFRRFGAARTVIVSLILTAIVRATHRSLPETLGVAMREGPLAYLAIFATGMAAAALTVQRRRHAPPWLLGGLVLGGLAGVWFGPGNGFGHDVFTSVAAFSLALLAADPNGKVAQALSGRALVHVGVFSYSIYLVHAPLLHLSWMALRPFQLSGDVEFALLCMVALPLIVLVCYVFHRLFERPFMRMKVAAALPQAQRGIG
jgi:peptidoglycan/LPS O-acetylase OafA/YrhL